MDCEEFFDTSAGDADGGAGGGGEAEESAYSLQQQIDDYQHTLGDAASSCFLLCVYIEKRKTLKTRLRSIATVHICT